MSRSLIQLFKWTISIKDHELSRKERNHLSSHKALHHVPLHPLLNVTTTAWHSYTTITVHLTKRSITSYFMTWFLKKLTYSTRRQESGIRADIVGPLRYRHWLQKLWFVSVKTHTLQQVKYPPNINGQWAMLQQPPPHHPYLKSQPMAPLPIYSQVK